MSDKIFTCNHTGSLKEALKSEKRISKEVFIKLIQSEIYQFYAYDERIKANRYIICNIENNLGLPTWINDYELLNIK